MRVRLSLTVIGVFIFVLVAFVLINSLFVGNVVAQGGCAADQVIMRLSAEDNAHGEVYNGAGSYPVEICYPDIFNGNDYPRSNPHRCRDNKIIGLSSSTNAHAEAPDVSSPQYTDPNNQVCYGNLECKNTTGQCSEFDQIDKIYKLVVSLSNNTNAHLTKHDFSTTYPVKICCYSASTGGEPSPPNISTCEPGINVYANISKPSGENFEIPREGGIVEFDGSRSYAANCSYDANDIPEWAFKEENFLYSPVNSYQDAGPYTFTGQNDERDIILSKPLPNQFVFSAKMTKNWQINSENGFLECYENENNYLTIRYRDRTNFKQFFLWSKSGGEEIVTVWPYYSWNSGEEKDITIVFDFGNLKNRYLYVDDVKVNIASGADFNKGTAPVPDFDLDKCVIGGTKTKAGATNQDLTGTMKNIKIYENPNVFETKDKEGRTIYGYNFPKTGAYGLGRSPRQYGLVFNWTFYKKGDTDTLISKRFGSWDGSDESYENYVLFNHIFTNVQGGDYLAKLIVAYNSTG